MTFIQKWKEQAEELEEQTYALYFAYRDPRTPWYAKALAAGLVAYALSPIDLIPDFIPVLGYLDDLLIIPLGVLLLLRLIPKDVMEDSRLKAAERLSEGAPQVKWIIAVILFVWIAIAALLIWLVIRIFLK